jgi:tRNA G10  N-methylase Trm11
MHCNQITANAKNKRKMMKNVGTGIGTSTIILPEEEEEVFSSERSIFGRIVAEGVSVKSLFAIRDRPFVGTTTLDPVASHLAAVSAHISPGSYCLDPFCGTGSLLIACANLGARVVGSDIDADCCTGTTLPDSPYPTNSLGSSNSSTLRSKNSRFRRSDGSQQFNKSTADNFSYYNVSHLLLGLFGADAASWIPSESRNKQKTDFIKFLDDPNLKVSVIFK